MITFLKNEKVPSCCFFGEKWKKPLEKKVIKRHYILNPKNKISPLKIGIIDFCGNKFEKK